MSGYMDVQRPLEGEHWVPAEVRIDSVGSRREAIASDLGTINQDYPDPHQTDPEASDYLTNEEFDHEWSERMRQPHVRHLEKIWINGVIKNVSRAFTHQFVRNRIGWSYSQQSLRWVDIQKMEVYSPPTLDENMYAPPAGKYVGMSDADLNNAISALLREYYGVPVVMHKEAPISDPRVEACRFIWDETMERISGAYMGMQGFLQDYLEDNGDPQPVQNATQDIRGILPTNVLTKIYFGCAFVGLQHASNHRLCHAAQHEIRFVFQEIKRKVAEKDPELGKHLKIICQKLGHCPQMPNDREKCSLPLSKVPAPRSVNKEMLDAIDAEDITPQEKVDKVKAIMEQRQELQEEHDAEVERKVHEGPKRYSSMETIN